MIYSPKDVLKIFQENNDIVNVGDHTAAPEQEWVVKAERAIGFPLPLDYLWFLNTFGGGEIGGEEIYSIYQIPFDEAVGGDIVYRNTIADGNARKGRLVISDTDFAEEFYILLQQDRKQVQPVFVDVGGVSRIYAHNFYEFICRRVLEHKGEKRTAP